MKEYNRKTRKWEEVDQFKSGAKRDLCKGKRPHDWVLLLPKWVQRDHDFSKDEILKFYALEKEEMEQREEMKRRFRELGIRTNAWSGFLYRFYRCSICGKEKSE